jgi:clan AA aspartic protease
MIRGAVNGRLELIIPLTLFDSAGVNHHVDAIIDTGYTGFLTLPPAIIAKLGVPLSGRTNVRLADGSVHRMLYYKVRLEWDGMHRTVDVLELDRDPLMGMQLLSDSRVTFDVVVGGHVDIEALP